MPVALALAFVGCGDRNGGKAAAGKAESKAEVQIETQVTGAPADVEPAPGEPGSDERAAAFATEAGKRTEAEKANVRGDDPAWFFLVRELKQLALGKFWEKDWTKIAANQTDPIPSMVEFHKLLADKGIDLVFVPVSAKASIYPDKLAAGFSPGDPWPLAPLFERLRSEGVNVLDIEPIMRKRRADKPDEKLWCEQDAHFSPLTCEIIAGLVKAEVEGKDWYTAHPKDAGVVRTEPMKLEISGDQIEGSEWEGKVGKETLTVRYAGLDPEGDGGNLEPVAPNAESPVLLMGDSHTLVFQEGVNGKMHCKGAGLLDQLAFELQIVPDHVGVRGSGLMQARRQLYTMKARAPGYWDNKKLVVWVFSVREFTQSTDKIISIPIER